MIKVTIAALFLIITGCTAIPVVSSLEGKCLSLVKDQYLWASNGVSYSGDFFISGIKEPQVAKYSPPIYKIRSNERVGISKILKDSNGSWGEFLRVQVKILDGPYTGTIADIPVHAPYHPREKWTKNFTLDPNALEFNEDIVVPCD